ncbi:MULTISPECIES: thioredoxin family protein [Bacillaceae]|uniref:Thioredoxin family protein n=1 Tax=Metabacillus sediminis TaxID=3117746 RepID=A0ABZ2NDV6_9BACI|nr:thioredoxin family protein [Bacillus sp. SJS]KZZ85705.1 thiol reductase thioredoxin [Bacillus sp. SJS]
MEKLQSMEQYKEIIQKENTVLMFSADWCPDCRVIDPFLPELEKDNQAFTFYYADRDEFIDLCAELSVFGIPSFVAFSKGQETGRFVSKDRKTIEQIQEFLNSIQ